MQEIRLQAVTAHLVCCCCCRCCCGDGQLHAAGFWALLSGDLRGVETVEGSWRGAASTLFLACGSAGPEPSRSKWLATGLASIWQENTRSKSGRAPLEKPQPAWLPVRKAAAAVRSWWAAAGQRRQQGFSGCVLSRRGPFGRPCKNGASDADVVLPSLVQQQESGVSARRQSVGAGCCVHSRQAARGAWARPPGAQRLTNTYQGSAPCPAPGPTMRATCMCLVWRGIWAYRKQHSGTERQKPATRLQAQTTNTLKPHCQPGAVLPA
jgi:hypothetical protein